MKRKIAFLFSRTGFAVLSDWLGSVRAEFDTPHEHGACHLVLPDPVIAAVNGAAYAGGCELALACDFIYAAEHCRFALTEVTLGIIPGAGGTSRAAGERRAKEIIFTGKPFTAAEALQWGLVNRVLSRTDLLAEALSTAEVIAQRTHLGPAGKASNRSRLEHVAV